MSDQKSNTKSRYTAEERAKHIADFRSSNQSAKAYCESKGLKYTTFISWMSETPEYKQRQKDQATQRGPYTPDERRRTVEAYLKSEMKQADFCKVWGVGHVSLGTWVKAYNAHGPQGLENNILSNGGAKRGPKGISEPLKQEIVLVKKENPTFGIQKVKDFLSRFKGVKVSKNTISKTVKENNLELLQETKKRPRKKSQPRRFERARPMQLWQSDITSYVLTRHSQRVYLTVFIDDHSRYIVSWNLQMRQTNELVVEALLNGVQKFGKPEEVLTDQGRQYFAWRGKSDFQKLLDKEGIKHVVARSHHPQTLGKCERFWSTVMQELWDRAKPQELTEARERLGHYIAHYNHFRPHQGLNGMTPADRFFGVESEVRKVIEETISKNELRLALNEFPRSPVFLIGQIGDKPLSMHGEGGNIIIHTPDGGVQKLNYENLGHLKGVPNDADQRETSQDRGDQANYVGESAGRAENIDRTREGEKATGSEEGLCSTAEACATGENAVADGNSGRKKEIASDGGLDNGILGGPDYEGRSSREARDLAFKSMAVVAASDLGDAGGVVNAAEDKIEGNDNEQGYGSEIFKKENSGARENDPNAGSLDRGDARDAGLQGRDHGSDQGTETSGSEESCNEKSEEDTARSSS